MRFIKRHGLLKRVILLNVLWNSAPTGNIRMIENHAQNKKPLLARPEAVNDFIIDFVKQGD